MDITEAKVLVTGGSSGIGRATARQLAALGARVAICGRDEKRLHAAAEEFNAIAIAADVGDEHQVRRLVQTVIHELDGYNVLINNAGFGTFGPLIRLTADEMTKVFRTNVIGAMLVARESTRHFIAESKGNIVNVASTAGSRGYANGTAYVASKFALTGMTECWRAELREHNIRVMQVNPSEVVTPFYAAAGRGDRPENPTKLHADDIANLIVSMLQLNDRGFVTDATVWATRPKD
jgi:3-oxoacyl-[acyl-carrier protein] reductase